MPLFVTRSNTWIVEFDSGDFIQFQVLGSKEQVPLPIHGWCRTAQEGERNTDPLTIDFHSLMQVGPPQDDMIASYIRSVSRNYVNTDLRVWFHAADALGQLQASSAVIRYHPAIPAGSQVRAVWAFLLGRRSCIVHPVKPPPFGLPDTIPQFIVTTVEGESFLASSTTGPIKCVGELLSFLLSLLSQGFGTFQQAVWGNQCVWYTNCCIRTSTPQGGSTFQWDQTIPLYEGFYLSLVESGPPSSTGSSTSDSADESVESTGSSVSNRSDGEADSGGGSEGSVLMQLPWQMDFEVEEANFESAIGTVVIV